jgi:hypothetical protein
VGSARTFTEGVRYYLGKWPLLVAWPGFAAVYYQALRYRRHYQGRLERAAISGNGFDIVTVVYKTELAFLRLQARSLARWLDPAFDGEIIIIVNDVLPSRSIKKIQQWILPDYGRWRDRVHVKAFYELGAGLNPYNGYVFQQPLKLAAADLAAQKFYVVFDAKNHAIKPFSATTFIKPDGRGIRAQSERLEMMHDYNEVCARYFDFDPATSMPFVAHTPFVFHTQSVRDLTADIERREGCTLFDFFRKTRRVSEFLLYAYYLRKRQEVDSLHSVTPRWWRTIWPHERDLAGIREAMTDPHVWSFGIHRCVRARANASDLATLTCFWRDRELLGKEETFVDLESDLKPSFMRRKKTTTQTRAVGAGTI